MRKLYWTLLIFPCIIIFALTQRHSDYLIETDGQYMQAIQRAAKQHPARFYLASYGLKADRQLYSILESLPTGCDVRIIVGVANDNESAYLLSHLSRWHIHICNSHMKVLITDKVFIIGSRNLTHSNLAEMSVILHDQDMIKEATNDFINTYNETRL